MMPTVPVQPPLPVKVNLAEKFALFSDHFSPKIAGKLNGQLIKLVKLKGEFVWHHHDDEDEMFLVVKGELVMRFKEGNVTLRPGEFIIVPRGVEHQPSAAEETEVLHYR